MSDRICLRCDREIEAWSGTRIVKREALCDACNEELDEEEEIERLEVEREWLWPKYEQLEFVLRDTPPGARDGRMKGWES